MQSAISQQLAEFERAVGAPLVARGAPLQLTPTGQRLLEHVEPILARVNAARADLATVDAGEGRALTVGVTEGEAVRLLVPIVEALRRGGKEPRVAPSDAGDGHELLERLEHCAIDLAFAELPLPPGPFEHIRLLDDPYVLLVPTGCRLAERPRRPSLQEIAALPLVGRVGSNADRELRARCGQLHIVQRAGSDSVVRALVAAGIGVAIVPRLSADAADRETVAIDLDDQLPRRSLALVWHRDRLPNPAAERFRQVAVETCGRIARARDSIDRL